MDPRCVQQQHYLYGWLHLHNEIILIFNEVHYIYLDCAIFLYLFYLEAMLHYASFLCESSFYNTFCTSKAFYFDFSFLLLHPFLLELFFYFRNKASNSEKGPSITCARSKAKCYWHCSKLHLRLSKLVAIEYQ